MTILTEITIEATAKREVEITAQWGIDTMIKTRPHDFTVRQGDDLRVIIEVVDQDGDPIDVQDVQAIRWAAARNIGDTVSIEKSLADTSIELGAGNVFFFDLEPADTEELAGGRYYHEAEIVTDQGRTYTILSGTMTLQRQLVRDPA